MEKALALKLQAQGIDITSPQTSIDAVAASVYADKPDLRSHAAPDGTVTILFSDIEGSTAMTSAWATSAGWSCCASTTPSCASRWRPTAASR